MSERKGSSGLKDGDFVVDYIRHGVAGYETYRAVRGSEDPARPFDATEQVTPDLTPAGVELAQGEAEKYFDHLDSKNDKLFFFSSNEARAIETANIYRNVAKERGFSIIKPEHSRSRISDDSAEGDIRILNTVSINSKNLLIDSVFNPANKRGDIDLEKIPIETRDAYERAVAIIDNDDQGSWGANFAKHGDKIKEIFPGVKTAEEVYDGKFRDFLDLISFGRAKAQENNQLNIKVLVFGHENMVIYVLEKYFGSDELRNCEVINFQLQGDRKSMSYRGESVDLK